VTFCCLFRVSDHPIAERSPRMIAQALSVRSFCGRC
jgi:hypothetical protein